MSMLIGGVRAPNCNSPEEGARVYISAAGVELTLVDDRCRAFEPVVARNLAALLVRASEEVERNRARPPDDCEGC